MHFVIDKLPIFFASVDDYPTPSSPYPIPCPLDVVISEHLEGSRTAVDLRWAESTTDQIRFVVRTAEIETGSVAERERQSPALGERPGLRR